jgi:hypothetical protein
LSLYCNASKEKIEKWKGNNMFTSILGTDYPVQSLVPAMQSFTSTAVLYSRPLLCLVILMMLLTIFRPMVVGVFQAIRLVFSPRLTLEERNGRRILQGVLTLNRMARDLESSEPSQAAELRQLASRC